MSLSLTDYVKDAITFIDSQDCMAMPKRPTETTAVSVLRRFVARLVHREESAHFTALHGFSVCGFDYKARFNEVVTNVNDVLDEHGRLYCKGNRGWHLSADPDCIASELNKTNLGVLPCHVREAQRRIDHDRQRPC